jgi:hypothetical protein
MALYSMQYTRRDNEALFIQAAKVSFRESLIHDIEMNSETQEAMFIRS